MISGKVGQEKNELLSFSSPLSETKPVLRRRSSEFLLKLQVYEGASENIIQRGGQNTPFSSTEFLSIDRGDIYPNIETESDILGTVPGRIYEEILLAKVPTNERRDEMQNLSKQ